jgi:hypothetical protein
MTAPTIEATMEEADESRKMWDKADFGLEQCETACTSYMCSAEAVRVKRHSSPIQFFQGMRRQAKRHMR